MFTLDKVVPWGRSFDEYCAMFDLSERELKMRVLDCGGGPASFNAEASRRNAGEFVWTDIRSVDELGARRLNAMLAFLDDYPVGCREGRYVTAELPLLPFADRAFDLALSSHLLFLYAEQLGEAFHRAARGFDVSIDNVGYEFQRGGNQMLRVRRPATDS